MQVDHNFFKDEVRDGFFVPGYMKHFWAAQMEVLCEIAKVCEKYEIQYYAAYGTLLGAVRHKGYIPWDDDLDICMTRENYERFLRVAPREFPETYRVLNCRNSDYYALYTRVVNTDGIMLDEEFVEKYHQIPYPAGVDVFVLDSVAKDEEVENQRDQIAQMIYSLSGKLDLNGENRDATIDMLRDIENICNIKLNYEGNLRRQLCMLTENLFQLFSKDESCGVSILSYYMSGKKDLIPFDMLDEGNMIPFEYMQIPVMGQPDVWLEQTYGDYMSFYRGGGLHNYPIYERNENALIHMLWDKSPFVYSFDKKDVCREQEAILEQAAIREEAAIRDRAAFGNSSVHSGQIEKENNSSLREIVFLCGNVQDWIYCEKLYDKLSQNEQNHVSVVVVPYYECKMDGKLGKEYYEGAEFEKFVQIRDYKEYCFDIEKPDVIITQNAFDHCNQSFIWPKEYYTSKLKERTKKLIYLTPYHTYEIVPEDLKSQKMMRYYVSIPGLAHCDHTLVQSEHIRNYYIEYLCACYGEDTREIWERKVWCEEDFHI